MKGDVDIMYDGIKILIAFLLEIVALILVIVGTFSSFDLYIKLNFTALYMDLLSFYIFYKIDSKEEKGDEDIMGCKKGNKKTGKGKGGK
jgi:hypothetical protein